ncbi:MAG: hypothetical protein [Bacteriophage sp.]|nr:MAG: hypothetical protein [Bacteriophage sp.]
MVSIDTTRSTISVALWQHDWTESQKMLLQPEYKNSILMRIKPRKSEREYLALESDEDYKKPIDTELINSCIFMYEENFREIMNQTGSEDPYLADDRDESINSVMGCDCHRDISIWRCNELTNHDGRVLFDKYFPVRIFQCNGCQKILIVFNLYRIMVHKSKDNQPYFSRAFVTEQIRSHESTEKLIPETFGTKSLYREESPTLNHGYILASREENAPIDEIIDGIRDEVEFYESQFHSILRNVVPSEIIMPEDRNATINELVGCRCYAYLSNRVCFGIPELNDGKYPYFPLRIWECADCHKRTGLIDLDVLFDLKRNPVESTYETIIPGAHRTKAINDIFGCSCQSDLQIKKPVEESKLPKGTRRILELCCEGCGRTTEIHQIKTINEREAPCSVQIQSK